MNRRITVAEYLIRRGLPADWQFGSPLGRVAARIYRTTYHREPGRAFRLINGRFREVMTYTPAEQHVLTEAWESYGSTAGRIAARPRPAAPARRTGPTWHGSGDAMRWTPPSGPLRNHP
ncbi:hypothetical protein LZP81_30960 [Streptomyces parvulus]|uniref:hypothetical protein n=1 Tax=Streptomyces parvulus TaxID=146923 RepID=UPI001E4F0004|nr:hypothetical protein [Streptomyces parvulus]MCC9154876.1 hypothetical protein [Streptomyces parvulus]MCE7691279.1 hypothetical protein [Streptomyces parvulus]